MEELGGRGFSRAAEELGEVFKKLSIGGAVKVGEEVGGRLLQG